LQPEKKWILKKPDFETDSNHGHRLRLTWGTRSQSQRNVERLLHMNTKGKLLISVETNLSFDFVSLETASATSFDVAAWGQV